MTIFRRTWIVCVVAIFLQGCGRGTGDLLFDVKIAPDVTVGGLWDGTGTDDFQPGLVVRVLGIVAEDGRTQYIKLDPNTGRPDFLDPGVQFGGSVSAVQDIVSGNIIIYAPIGSTFQGGLTAVNGTLDGVIVEGLSVDSFEGIWTAQTGESGTFAQLASESYDKASSLDITTGVWLGTSSIGGSITLTINSQGTIQPSFDSNGCIYSSTAGNGIVLIDPLSNVYAVNINITNCGLLNSNYQGLGYVGLLSDPDDLDTLTISVDDGTIAFIIEVERV
jgi:hypothetical protein